MRVSLGGRSLDLALRFNDARILQDVAAQVLILHDVGKLLGYISGIDLNVFLL